MGTLTDHKVGDFSLLIDLLGTAERMSDFSNWLDSLKEILHSVVESIYETADMVNPERSQKVFQHGDSILFPNDDPQLLIGIGIRVLTRLWGKNILAQAALAGGGCYFLTDPSGLLGQLLCSHPNVIMQVLVGPSVARSHIVLKKVKGPRFLIDEETATATISPYRWRRYIGKGGRQYSGPGETAINTSEIAWWADLINVEEDVDNRLTLIRREIEGYKKEMQQSPVAILWKRDIESMKKREEHLLTFLQILQDDPS